MKLGRHLVVECDFGGGLFSLMFILHGVQGCIWSVLVVDLGLNRFPYNVAMEVSLLSIMNQCPLPLERKIIDSRHFLIPVGRGGITLYDEIPACLLRSNSSLAVHISDKLTELRYVLP